jgi:hypothetical protein
MKETTLFRWEENIKMDLKNYGVRVRSAFIGLRIRMSGWIL